MESSVVTSPTAAARPEVGTYGTRSLLRALGTLESFSIKPSTLAVKQLSASVAIGVWGPAAHYPAGASSRVAILLTATADRFSAALGNAT
jgi:hypothetical protein